MRRIKLVVAVLAMLVVMVGSAVPAMTQDLFGNEQINFDNQGYDPDQDGYYNNYNYYDGEDNWECIPEYADEFGFDIFFVQGPLDCPAGYRAQLVEDF